MYLSLTVWDVFFPLSLSEIRFNRLKMVLKEGGRVGGWEREEEENEERAPRALQFYKLRRRERDEHSALWRITNTQREERREKRWCIHLPNWKHHAHCKGHRGTPFFTATSCVNKKISKEKITIDRFVICLLLRSFSHTRMHARSQTSRMVVVGWLVGCY